MPGLGHKSATRIIAARRSGLVRVHDLKRLGVEWRRAMYFLQVPDHAIRYLDWDPRSLRERLTAPMAQAARPAQGVLF